MIAGGIAMTATVLPWIPLLQLAATAAAFGFGSIDAKRGFDSILAGEREVAQLRGRPIAVLFDTLHSD